MAKNCLSSGPDQCQSCRDAGQRRPECPHSPAHHAGMGQVLPSAVWWLLHFAVDRRRPLLPGLQHSGGHGGRAAQRQCEKILVYGMHVYAGTGTRLTLIKKEKLQCNQVKNINIQTEMNKLSNNGETFQRRSPVVMAQL